MWSPHWSSSIDVLVTDIVMPGLHGHELAGLIRVTRPGIGIVLMSDYTDHALGRGTELGAVEFLIKPFTAAALSVAVGRAADAAKAAAASPRRVAADD